MIMKKNLMVSILLVVSLLLALTGCGASSESEQAGENKRKRKKFALSLDRISLLHKIQDQPLYDSSNVLPMNLV